MKKALLVSIALVVMYVVGTFAAGTTVNGTRVINGDLTVKGTCTGCSGGLTVGTTTIGSGTSGAILYNNAGVLGNVAVVPGANGGGLVFREGHTVSGATELDFTTCIDPSFIVYQVEIVELVASASAATFGFQMSTDGGMTYDTTSGHYSNADWVVTNGGASGASGDTITTMGRIGQIQATAAANTSFIGTFKLYNPAGTSLKKEWHGTSNYPNFTSRTVSAWLDGGAWLSTSAYNAFRITVDTGTFSGASYCYGLAKN